MRLGKLTSKELEENVLSFIRRRRKEILKSGAIGADCAAFKTDKIITVTGDPITAQCKNSGALAIHISANDIAASGSKPLAAHLTILAPPNASTREIAEIMRQAESVCEQLSMEIIGGHTEFTDAVNRVIVSCVMIGLGDVCLSGEGAQQGDKIIMTKTAGIEGTIILAEKDPDALNEEETKQLSEFYCQLSVVDEGGAAVGLVSGMHDITEGGVLGAICEICENKGARIDIEKIPVHPLTRKLCKKYSLNPYRLLSSGSMLMTTRDAQKVLRILENKGIQASVIGEICADKVIAKDGNDEYEVQIQPDEICKI